MVPVGAQLELQGVGGGHGFSFVQAASGTGRQVLRGQVREYRPRSRAAGMRGVRRAVQLA